MFGWMLLLSLSQLGAAPAQPEPAPKPLTQQCPDGAVVLATDLCPVLWSHRYSMHHEPPRREFVERWWCGRSKEPNEARFAVELIQPTTRTGMPYYVSRLLSLSVNGLPASPELVGRVGDELAGLKQLVGANSRCLNVRPDSTVGILLLRGPVGESRGVELR
jgi:hypothetical protein